MIHHVDVLFFIFFMCVLESYKTQNMLQILTWNMYVENINFPFRLNLHRIHPFMNEKNKKARNIIR